MALNPGLLIRMRSQVQVLAGPPPIPAGQSAVGSEPGMLAASLGRAGAAAPPRWQAHRPCRGPSTRTSGSTTTTHRGRAPSPGRQPRGGCGHLAPQPAPAPTAQPQRQVLRTPAWPAWSLSGHTRPPPHPPGQAPATPLTNVRPRQRRRPKPAGPSTERLDGTAATGTSTASCGDGCPRGTSLVPTPPSGVGGDGRVRTGGHQTAGHRTVGHRTVDTRGLDAGRVDSRRAGQPDPGRPQMGGWTPHAGHRPATDAMAGVLAVSTTATPDAGCRLEALPGRCRLGEQQPQDSSAARSTRGTMLLRTGLATAATVSCTWYAAVQLAPRRTALLRRLRVERRAAGSRSSVMAGVDRRSQVALSGAEGVRVCQW